MLQCLLVGLRFILLFDLQLATCGPTRKENDELQGSPGTWDVFVTASIGAGKQRLQGRSVGAVDRVRASNELAYGQDSLSAVL